MWGTSSQFTEPQIAEPRVGLSYSSGYFRASAPSSRRLEEYAPHLKLIMNFTNRMKKHSLSLHRIRRTKTTKVCILCLSCCPGNLANVRISSLGRTWRQVVATKLKIHQGSLGVRSTFLGISVNIRAIVAA
jgi:hypothetical protein